MRRPRRAQRSTWPPSRRAPRFCAPKPAPTSEGRAPPAARRPPSSRRRSVKDPASERQASRTAALPPTRQSEARWGRWAASTGCGATLATRCTTRGRCSCGCCSAVNWCGHHHPSGAPCHWAWSPGPVVCSCRPPSGHYPSDVPRHRAFFSQECCITEMKWIRWALHWASRTFGSYSAATHRIQFQ
jgi:hypothetical protein